MKKIYALLFLSALSFSVDAQTVNLTPSKDNSMFADNLSNSNGLGPLFSGSTCFSSSRRALMQFDVSSIPAGAVITSATLTVNVNQTSVSSSVTHLYNIYALTTDFGEGTSSSNLGLGAAAVAPDATWSDAMLGTSTWTTPGGDFAPSNLSAVSMGGVGSYTFATEVAFVAAVQSWVNTPASNFGIIMIGDESTSCTARKFGSKDSGTAPVLSVTYTLPCAGPTAVCQDVSVYLNAGGTGSIVAADIDGGSTDDCNTGGLTLSASQTSFSCSDIGTGGTGGLQIAGAYDGPLTGGTPKGVELYAGDAIADLSNYGIGSANNGGGTDGEEFTFPAISVPAGTYLYVTTDSAQFNAFFGFDADFVDGSMAINGDDAVELFQNGAVIDVFGDINTDGTGQPWEYQDGWAYRNDLQGANAGVFNEANWSYSGVNALDGETSNSTAATPFPNGSFTAGGSGIPVTLTVTDGLGNVDSCVAIVSVLDTITPSPDITILPDVTSNCAVNSLTPPQAQDNCAGSFPGVTTTPFPITSSTTVTWTYTDGSGNSYAQDQVVTITPLDITTTVVDPTITANATGVTYQWIDCSDNSQIAGETGQSFTATTTGDYAVIITDGPCSDTSACVQIAVEGIDELIDLGMTVSPNPSAGIFHVSFENTVSGTVTIVDANGRLIQTQELNGTSLMVDLKSAQSGLYFMNVTTEKGISRARIVKQ